jgi:nucleotidyltransferase substrate binding protein (TIGR01987 family)
MKNKLSYSLKNVELAFKQLKLYVEEPIVNDRDRSGIIKAFEFTFELLWKTFQKIAKDEGLEAAGPKSSLKAAYKMDLIKNEEEVLWIQMLEDRNLMVHTYHEYLSREIVHRIQQSYLPAIMLMLTRLHQLKL